MAECLEKGIADGKLLQNQQLQNALKIKAQKLEKFKGYIYIYIYMIYLTAIG